ncbi:MAG: ScpA family protein [Candidatus Micrarchaeota archaeon]|nr:ScpA family protein [Candidatus Micrarchaeota archaeon]
MAGKFGIMGAPGKGKEKDEVEPVETFETDDEPKAGKKVTRAPVDSEEEDITNSQEHVDTSKMAGEDLRLEKLVEFPTWREMLLDLVAAKRLDPWNIDIVEVTSGYIERIKKMELLDLRVPANLILAAAILLRFKSDALRFEEEAQVVVQETYVEEDSGTEVIPVLELKTRIPPKRMVTLDELLLAMERVFEDQKKREDKAAKIDIPSVINIQLPEFNIEQRMAEVYRRVNEEKDTEGLATFTSILNDKTPLGIIATLLPVLHLVQDKKITIFQEKFFGEIFIRVREETAKESEAEAKRKEKAAKEEKEESEEI